jgi:ribose-phosphate pyrophosphokinase
MSAVLNLANPNDRMGAIPYKISSFPDGQQSISILKDWGTQPKSSFDVAGKEPITIRSRMNSFQDLELIICAASALRELGVKIIDLYIPYCLGGRSDRKFAEGGFNYIKNVIAPIINMQKFNSVTILDPHSDVLEACLDNFRKVDNVGLVRWSLADYFARRGGIFSEQDLDRVKLISPDAGALKKVYNVAENLNYTEPIVIAAKHRDMATGQITHTEVPLGETSSSDDFFILDDICDGGRTFTEIAKVIKANVWPNGEHHEGKIFLIVTHGIFSAGYEELEKYFDMIYTTNSINTHTNPKIQQLNVF